MNNEDLQKLKAAATAVENHGVIRSMALPTSEILALIAEVEQARIANGWLPIETAPKDGSVVLTARQVRHGRGYAIEGMTKNSAGWWVTVDGDRPSQPTHWMQLPAAPQ